MTSDALQSSLAVTRFKSSRRSRYLPWSLQRRALGALAESLEALMRPANARIARIVSIPFVGSWLRCFFDVDDLVVAVSPWPPRPRRLLWSRLSRQSLFTDFATSFCNRPIDALPSVA